MDKNVSRLFWLLVSVGVGVISAMAYEGHERSKAAAGEWPCSSARTNEAVARAAEAFGDYETARWARRDMDRALDECGRR
ncbi:MAG TPA: hypothetical protein VM753_11930 [Anaeromyxobacter sp.]|nr:hypothetical protein [Anaeromyxobacter sp.]